MRSWHRVTRIPHEGKTPPTRFNAKKHEERFLKVLLSRLPDVEREGRRLLAPVVDKETNLVVAMAVTQVRKHHPFHSISSIHEGRA